MRDSVHRSLRRVGTRLSRTPLGDLSLASHLWGRLMRAMDPESVERGAWVPYCGAEIFVDPTEGVGKPLYNSGEYEPHVTACLRDHTPEGGRAFDVGAHLGHHTIAMRQAVGPTGSVYAFEPNEAVLPYLRKTLDRNGFSNVTLVEKAVSDTSGTARLVHGSGNRGTASLADGRAGDGGDEIRTVTLADHLEDGPIDVLKMDIEGHESAALRGLSDHVEAVRCVVLELHKGMLSTDELTEIDGCLGSFDVIRDLEADRVVDAPSAIDGQRGHVLCKRT